MASSATVDEGSAHQIFVAGGTGYIGHYLVSALLNRGHRVAALARPGSESKVPPGAAVVVGDPFSRATFVDHIAPADTFIQLVGVPHPSPFKARQFVEVDLRSALESIEAANAARVRHFIYVSVTHPAPVMRAYQDVRCQVEQALADADLSRTIVRPWYVLGPGHLWPYTLLPLYLLFERLPSTRDTALRLGLVTIHDMVATLVNAVERPSFDCRIIEVPEIRAIGSRASAESRSAGGSLGTTR